MPYTKQSIAAIVGRQTDNYNNPGTHIVYALDASGYAWTWGKNNLGQMGTNSQVRASSPVSVVGGKQFTTIVSTGNASSGVPTAIHSVGLDTQGYAWSWGTNAVGQLGDGTTIRKSSPVSVLGNRSFTSIYSANVGRFIALDGSGYAWAWGDTQGVAFLGDGTTTSKSSPVSVVGNKTFTKIATAGGTFLGLDENGYAWTWGLNFNGSAGTNSSASTSSPVSVVGGKKFTKVVGFAGAAAFLALDDSSYAWAWGGNGFGLLGDGTIANKSSPVSVLGGRQFVDIFIGGTWASTPATTVAIDGNGALWAWGLNDSGNTGDGARISRSSPVSVLGLTNIVKLANGGGNWAALNSSGKVWTWGINNTGQLGDGTTSNRSSPVSIAGTYSDLITTTAGSSSVGFGIVALDISGNLWSWGGNTNGELGVNSIFNASSPVAGPGFDVISPFPKMTSANVKNLGFVQNSSAVAVNVNFETQGTANSVNNFAAEDVNVTNGSLSNFSGSGSSYSFDVIPTSTGPVTVSIPADVCTDAQSDGNIANTFNYTFYKEKFAQGTFIDKSGNLWAWGRNNSGQLGLGVTNDASAPYLVAGDIKFQSNNLSKLYSSDAGWELGIDSSGYAWAWGYNLLGQLGAGDLINKSSPVSVLGSRKFTKFVKNGFSCIALDESGYAWGWGSNTYAPLGIGSSAGLPVSSPSSVIGGKIFTQIAQNGTRHGNASFATYNSLPGFIALDESGYAWGWGNNRGSSSLGINDSTNFIVSSPTSVVGGIQFKKIIGTNGSGGEESWYGLDLSDYAWAWGRNSLGQLGNGTTTSASSPVSVVGSRKFTDLVATQLLDAGGYTTVGALDTSGTVWTWGSHLYGALGNNQASAAASSPVSVVGDKVFHKLFGFDGNLNAPQVGNGFLAIDNAGNAWAWGQNGYGNLGDGTFANKSSPVSILGSKKFADIVTVMDNRSQRYLSCFGYEPATNTLWGWGSNFLGNLGDSTTVNRSSPVAVTRIAPTLQWAVSQGDWGGLLINKDGSTNRSFATARITWNQGVKDFDVSDISANVSISGFNKVSSYPATYEISLYPSTWGNVSVSVPSAAVTNAFDVSNISGSQFSYNFGREIINPVSLSASSGISSTIYLDTVAIESLERLATNVNFSGNISRLHFGYAGEGPSGTLRHIVSETYSNNPVIVPETIDIGATLSFEYLLIENFSGEYLYFPALEIYSYASMQISVNDAPAITSGSISATNITSNSISISWPIAAPSSGGGTVEYSAYVSSNYAELDNLAELISPTATQILAWSETDNFATAGSLSSGTKYYFAVLARDSNGIRLYPVFSATTL